MFAGYLIVGFMLGFIVGVGGGYMLAKRSEIRYVQQAIRDQTPPTGFKIAMATQGHNQRTALDRHASTEELPLMSDMTLSRLEEVQSQENRYTPDDFYNSVPAAWRYVQRSRFDK